MSHSKDDKGDEHKPQDLPPESAQSDKRSGRVAFDSRGNPIWEWQLETGVYSRDVNTQKLKKLNLGELSIADSGIHPQPIASAPGHGKPATPATPKPAQLHGKPAASQNSRQTGGFNPYDSGSTGSGNRNLGGGGGINPYDSQGRPPGAGTDPYDRARALGKRLDPEAAPEQRRRTPADLRKLDQQIKEQRKKPKE
jgi:hypothetical protein